MGDFTSLVNGWPFADLRELMKRIRMAEEYAATHVLSDRQRRTIEEMKAAALKAGEPPTT
jgi:hypothetical protein